jgi:hypothetical protein
MRLADMADTKRLQQVELQLAESGRELAAVIEAAQFARVIDQGSPEDPADAVAIEAFVALFATAAERWDELGPVTRAGLLARLGEQLETLERCGWFVHWGTSALGVRGRQQGALQLPLALLSISRSSEPTIQARIAGELAIDPGSGAVH